MMRLVFRREIKNYRLSDDNLHRNPTSVAHIDNLHYKPASVAYIDHLHRRLD